MRHLTFLFLALASCRPAGLPAPEPPPAVALSAGTVRYTLTGHQLVKQTVRGQAIATNTAIQLVFSVSLTPTDSGLAAEVVVESAALEGDAGGMGDAATAAGARITGHVGSPGHRFARDEDAAPHELLDQLALRLHELLPPLPQGGVVSDATWSDSTVVTGRASGLPLTLTSRATSYAGPWDRLDGNPVLALRRSAAYMLDGEGDPTGSWVILRGQGVSHGRFFIDPAGAVVLGVCADTLRADVELGGTDLVIPLVQTRVDTLRRVTP